MRIAAALIACAACSGPAADPSGDAAVLPAGQLVTATAFAPMTETSVTLPIPPPTDGELVVVLIRRASAHAAIDRVAVGDGVLDDWQQSRMSDGEDCPGTVADIWISNALYGPVAAGASTATITTSGPETFAVYVYELAGVSGPRTSGELDTLEPAMIASAPVLDATPGSIVLSTVTVCGDVTGLVPASPFITLPDAGANAAYYVPTTAGSYGAAWSTSGGLSASNTVVFR